MSPGPEVFLVSNTVYPGVSAIEIIVITRRCMIGSPEKSKILKTEKVKVEN